MMRYLDPKNDLTFKKIFGEHPDLLMSLLNALMPFEKNQEIIELEYLPAEQTPVVPELKNSLVDVKCKDIQGRQFIIEMQMLWTDSFKHRVLFNASKAYIRQIGIGDDYDALQPVYALSFVNQEYTTGTEFYHHYSIVNIEDTQQHLEGLEFIFVELPKFRTESIRDKKMMVLWLRFLTEIKHQSENVSSDFKSEDHINKALNVLEESSFSLAELETYEKYWDSVSRERTLFGSTMEKVRKQAREEAREETMQEALSKLVDSGMSLEEAKRILGL